MEVSESESCSVVSDSLRPHGQYSPWNSPGQNTGVGSLSLLQGIFRAWGSNPGFPHCRWILYQLSHDGSKVRCYKEQYCIGTWNARSMNQGKLEVVKQEMARVNIDILGISKWKWTGMGEFNSDDHYVYYCGQESLRRNGVAIKVNRRVWNAVLGRSLKNDRMISVCFQGKPFNITVIQVYASSSVIH